MIFIEQPNISLQNEMFSSKKPVSLILQLAVLVTGIFSERDFFVNIDSILCTHNPEYIKLSNCSTDKSLDRPRGYVDVQLQKDLFKIFYTTEITFRYKKIVRKLLSINNANGCEFFRGKKVVSLLRFVRNILNQFGKLPNGCPVKKEFHFLFKDIFIDEDKMMYISPPDGKFVLNTTIHSEKDFYFHIIFNGTISRKRTEEIN